MPPEKHALLSASAAHIWLHCTPAPRLCESLPDKETKYAAEGTVAHALAELKARKKFVEPMGPRAYSNRRKKIEADPLYTKEMDTHTDTYIEALTEEVMRYDSTPLVLVEAKVDYSDIAPEGFGTADCIIVGGSCLTVCDFKYGQGVPVSAVDNPQMQLYALGALGMFRGFYDIRTVRMRIVQPRGQGAGPEPNVWEISREDLEQWGGAVAKPRAQAAFAGTGDAVPGDWCRFCRANGRCRAQTQYLALEAFGSKAPPLLSDAEVGDILNRAKGLSRWVSAVEDYALSACLAGKDIPGWKAVEGRSVRAWVDQDKALEVLEAGGYAREILYDTVPKSLSQLEKLTGKVKFAELVGNLITRPAGKPTLAEAGDTRPAYNPAVAAFGGGDNA